MGDRFFQEWTTSWLLRVGLPVLSAISGYLMLWGWQQSWSFYARKIRRRIQSLLIPFLSVSLLTVLTYACIQALPGTAGFFEPPLIRDWSLAELWNRLIINPLNYPLYFLRDLFLVALLAPLLAWLLRSPALALPTLLALFLLWWFQQDLWHWNIRLLTWFSVGSALALHPNWRWRPSRGLFITALVLWLVISACGAWDATVGVYRDTGLNNMAKLLGIPVFFYGVLSIPNRGKLDRFLYKMTPWSFPLFLLHNPIVNLMKKVFMKMVGDTPFLPTFAWLCAWIGAAAVLVWVIAPLGSRFGGRFWTVITGNR